MNIKIAVVACIVALSGAVNAGDIELGEDVSKYNPREIAQPCRYDGGRYDAVEVFEEDVFYGEADSEENSVFGEAIYAPEDLEGVMMGNWGQIIGFEKPLVKATFVPSWVTMDKKGTKWFYSGTNRFISGLSAEGSDTRDKKSIAFQTRSLGADLNNKLAFTSERYTVRMTGMSSGIYSCDEGFVIDALYYTDSRDNSIDYFQCRKLVTHFEGYYVDFSAGHWVDNDLGRRNTCKSKEAIVGLNYNDQGDDHVLQLYCMKVKVLVD